MDNSDHASINGASITQPLRKTTSLGANLRSHQWASSNNNHDTGGATQHGPLRLIPFSRNGSLVHRSILAALDRLLSAAVQRQSAALWGHSGSGKTQIALEYAYRRNQEEGCSVFWIHADNEATFTQDYRLVAKRLGLRDSLDGPEMLMAVRNRIETTPSWLTVVDNANDLEMFGVFRTNYGGGEAHSLYDYVPQGHAGRVLWTSRDERIGGSLVNARQAINVGSMTENEAWTLFGTGMCKELSAEVQNTKTLLTTLGRLPLSIWQAAAYMRETCTSISEYISEVNERMGDTVTQHGSDLMGLPQALGQTSAILIEHIRRRNQTSYDILHILAFMDNRNISLELIASAAAILEKLTEEGAATYLRTGFEGKEETQLITSDVISAIELLQIVSLLRLQMTDSQSNGYCLHETVQVAARFSLKQQHRLSDEKRYIKAAIRAIKYQFSTRERDQCNANDRHLVHAWRVAHHARSSHIEMEAASLLDQVSNYLRGLGRWSEQERVTGLAYRIREGYLGREHPDTIRSMTELADTYSGQRKYNAAEKIYLDLLELWHNMPGVTHLNMLHCMQSLTTIYYGQKRYDEAQKMYVRILELQRDHLGN